VVSSVAIPAARLVVKHSKARIDSGQGPKGGQQRSPQGQGQGRRSQQGKRGQGYPDRQGDRPAGDRPAGDRQAFRLSVTNGRLIAALREMTTSTTSARIPNPLEQTFDRRFAKGSKRITSGFGRPDQNDGKGGRAARRAAP
jgi:23S rRNA pseudouridine2605 synthase